MNDTPAPLSTPPAPAKTPQRGENLRPWHFKPGQSGNPSGRAKGAVSLGEMLKQRLRERPEEAAALVHNLLQDAIDGVPDARKIVFDRHDGPVVVKIEGLTEEQLVEKLAGLLRFLKDRLPPDSLPALTDATREYLGQEQGA